MRIELIEKIVFVFAVIAIVLVAGLVGFFSFVMQKESGISDEEVRATIEVDKWLEEARALANGQTLGPQVILPASPVTRPAGAAAGAPGAGGTPAANRTDLRPGQVDNYFDPNAQIPQDQQVAGIPWLRKQEGVTYMKPEPVPQILYEKYQGFDDAWAAAQDGAGEFVDGRYRINWVNPQSYLSSKAGLKDGDEIVSVNGHPIGQSFAAGKALYDQLKSEKRFAVKVRRNGTEVVLSFFVN